MNFSDFITNHGKRVNKDAFIHLVQISRVDGKIMKEEFDLLHMEGKKFGLTDPEIDQLIDSEKGHNYNPPYSLEEKFDHLYNIAEMILADSVISDCEVRMIKRFAIEAGFNDSKIDSILEILFEGVKNDLSEEKLYKQFRRHILNPS